LVQINKDLFDDLTWDPAKLKIFDGPLFNPGIAMDRVSAEGQGLALDF
jgi:hypothetical protein